MNARRVMAPVPTCCGPTWNGNRRFADIEAERAAARLAREQFVGDWVAAAMSVVAGLVAIAIEVSR